MTIHYMYKQPKIVLYFHPLFIITYNVETKTNLRTSLSKESPLNKSIDCIANLKTKDEIRHLNTYNQIPA